MSTILHRHDISDEAWALIEPHMLGQKGQWGGLADDNADSTVIDPVA